MPLIKIKKTKEILEVEQTIIPAKNLYLTYSTIPFCPVEYYYDIENIYPLNVYSNPKSLLTMFASHKLNFSAPLNKINEDKIQLKPVKR